MDKGNITKKVLMGAGIVLIAACILSGRCAAEPSRCPYDIHLSIMYNYLTDDQRLLYDQIYDAIFAEEERVIVPDGMSRSTAEWMIDYIYNEAPELCTYERWSTEVLDTNDGKLEIRFAYKFPRSVQDQFMQEVDELAASFRGMSEKDGIQNIHDYVINRFDYGTVEGEDTQLAYFALKNNKAICNGYAQTVAMLCHFAGYPCSYIDGNVYDNGGEGISRHAWNVASIDTQFLWFDPTWDDTEQVRAWYGLDGVTMSQTHIPDPEYEPIKYLNSCLPDNVTRTLHLDVRRNNEYLRGLGEQNPVTVSQNDLGLDERYAPAMVIWNNGHADFNVVVSYCLDGKKGQWNEATINPGSNLAFRISEWEIDEIYGRHDITWYCNGNRVGVFTWKVD